MTNLLFNTDFRIDAADSALYKSGTVSANGYATPSLVEGWKFISYPGTPVTGTTPPVGTTPPTFAITRVDVTAAENQTTKFDGSKFLKVVRTGDGVGRPLESFYGFTQEISWAGKEMVSDATSCWLSFTVRTDRPGTVGVSVRRDYGSGGKGPSGRQEESCCKEAVTVSAGTGRYFVRVVLPKPGTYTTGTSPHLDIYLIVQEGGIVSGKSFALVGTYLSIIQPQLEFSSREYPSEYRQDNPLLAEAGVEVKGNRVWQTGDYTNTRIETIAAAGTATTYLDGPVDLNIFTLQGAVTFAATLLKTVSPYRTNSVKAIIRHDASVGVGDKALTFPGAWKWTSTVPDALASTKIGILSLVGVPTELGDATTVVAKWEAQDVTTFSMDTVVTNKLVLSTADATKFLQSTGGYYTFNGTQPLLADDIKFSGEVWDDSMVPAMSLRTQGTADPALNVVLGSGGIRAYVFSGSATNELFGSVQLPHSYKEGTTIKPHVHWMPTTAGTGDVYWGLEYSWQNVDGTFSAPTTISATAAAGGTAWVHKIANLTDITGTGKTISSILVFRLYRLPTDAGDTYADGAALLGFDLHFLKDTVGSATATAK